MIFNDMGFVGPKNPPETSNFDFPWPISAKLYSTEISWQCILTGLCWEMMKNPYFVPKYSPNLAKLFQHLRDIEIGAFNMILTDTNLCVTYLAFIFEQNKTLVGIRVLFLSSLFAMTMCISWCEIDDGYCRSLSINDIISSLITTTNKCGHNPSKVKSFKTAIMHTVRANKTNAVAFKTKS